MIFFSFDESAKRIFGLRWALQIWYTPSFSRKKEEEDEEEEEQQEQEEEEEEELEEVEEEEEEEEVEEEEKELRIMTSAWDKWHLNLRTEKPQCVLKISNVNLRLIMLKAKKKTFEARNSLDKTSSLFSWEKNRSHLS